MDENDKAFLVKIVKSIFFTFVMLLVFMFGLYGLVGLSFKNMSVEQSNTWIIICMCIGIIFTLFFCTFTIIDEIKKRG